jgi:hypothetical protein
MKHQRQHQLKQQSHKLRHTWLVLPILLNLIGCSQVNFYKNGEQTKPPVTFGSDENGESSSPSTAPLSMNGTKVTYPSYANVANVPYQYARTQIFVNPQLDNQTCTVVAQTDLLESGLCTELPDLCESYTITTVHRTSDFTCHQAFRAIEILNRQSSKTCQPQSQALSNQELEQINNPNIYETINEPTTDSTTTESLTYAVPINLIDHPETDGATPDPKTVLPILSTIAIDSSCNCTYNSSGSTTVIYKYPALEAHCHSHFNTVW